MKALTMDAIESFTFNFQGEEYTALKYVRGTADSPRWCVTIMNGEVEIKFFGFHQFILVENLVKPVRIPDEPIVRTLQEIICKELQKQTNYLITENR